MRKEDARVTVFCGGEGFVEEDSKDGPCLPSINIGCSYGNALIPIKSPDFPANYLIFLTNGASPRNSYFLDTCFMFGVVRQEFGAYKGR